MSSQVRRHLGNRKRSGKGSVEGCMENESSRQAALEGHSGDKSFGQAALGGRLGDEGSGQATHEGHMGGTEDWHWAAEDAEMASLPSRRIRERCHVEALLGKGSYGDVWLCREKATGRPLACKVVQKPEGRASPGQQSGGPRAGLPQKEAEEGILGPAQRHGGVEGESDGEEESDEEGEEEQEEEREGEEGEEEEREGEEGVESGSMMLKEAQALQMLGSLHPGVVRLFEVMETRTRTELLMEYCRGGDLFDLIERNGPMPEAAAKVLFTQLASALAFCHSRRVLHRDIKPENIFLDEPASAFYSGPPANDTCQLSGSHVLPRVRPVIADFGLAVYLTPGDMVSGPAGSELYCSPEVLKGELYSLTADVWSLGLVLYALLTGRLPMEEAGTKGEKEEEEGEGEGDVSNGGDGGEGDVINASRASSVRVSPAGSFVSDDDVSQDLDAEFSGQADVANDHVAGGTYGSKCSKLRGGPETGPEMDLKEGGDMGRGSLCSSLRGGPEVRREVDLKSGGDMDRGSVCSGLREGSEMGGEVGLRRGGEMGRGLQVTESQASSDECLLEVVSLVSEDDVSEESAAASPELERGRVDAEDVKDRFMSDKSEKREESGEGSLWQNEQLGSQPQQALKQDPVWSWDVTRGIDFDEVQWGSISYSAQDLIQRMLEYDPVQRLQSFEVLAHPWVTDGEGEGSEVDSECLSFSPYPLSSTTSSEHSSGEIFPILPPQPGTS